MIIELVFTADLHTSGCCGVDVHIHFKVNAKGEITSKLNLHFNSPWFSYLVACVGEANDSS